MMDIRLKEQVDAWFRAHRQEMVEGIMALVSIPSVAAGSIADAPYGAGCKAALQAFLAMAERMGFAARNFENHCGAACMEEKEKTIGFWGHLDVVPEGGDWDFDPFHPVCREGFLIGRGADDNKGPVVGMLYVLRCLKELGIKTRCGLKVFAGCQEEAGMEDVRYYLERYPAPDLNIIPDCAFPVCYGEKGILEAEIIARDGVSPDILSLSGGTAANVVPDTAQITLRAAPGVLEGIASLPPSICVRRQEGSVQLTARGKSCHAAFPLGGINAIHVLMKALLEAGILAEPDRGVVSFLCGINEDVYGTALDISMRDEDSGDLTCVGSVLSLKDRRISLQLNIRYCVSADARRLMERMEQRCSEHLCGVHCLRDSGPGYFPREHPAVRALTGIYNAYTGQQAEPYTMGGGTYARKLPNALGFGLGGLPRRESVLFRPGHGFAHCPDEALDVENFLRALTIFALGVLEADRIMA